MMIKYKVRYRVRGIDGNMFYRTDDELCSSLLVHF